MVLVAVGRRPVTDTLNLERPASTTDDKGFIAVDAQRARRSPNIYAIGDVTGEPLLAHKAMKEGVVAAEVIAGDKSAAFDPVAIPNCVYTDPEVATVGLSEEEAKAAGYEVRDRQVPADGQRPRAHDERDRRPDQARRRREDRSAARHAHRRAASRIADRRRRDRARDGRDARRHRPLDPSASDARPNRSWTRPKRCTAKRSTSSIQSRSPRPQPARRARL